MEFLREMKKSQLKGSPSLQHCVTMHGDRLGSLPEDIQKRIVSFLPVQDALRTCILSKKWRYKCFSLPNLIFEYSHFPDVERKLDRFVECINQMICRHGESEIKTFKLNFWVKNESCSRTDLEWIVFAVQHKVKNLILHIEIEETETLPFCLFTSKSLKTMQLALLGHVFILPKVISLPNLKELYFATVSFVNSNLTQNLFSSCPALETLVICHCNLSSLARLTISAPKLKFLHIYKCYWLHGCEIKLQTPCLQDFAYNTNMARDFNLGDIYEISEACILFEEPIPSDRNKGDLVLCAVKVLRGLSHVCHLLLNEWFIEFLFSKGLDSLKSVYAICFHFLVNVKLYMWPVKEHVQKIIALLSLFRGMRTLCIAISAHGWPSNMSTLEMNSQVGVEGMFNYLEFVTIQNFEGRDCELEIVKFLLGKAKVLEDLKITTRCESDEGGINGEASDEKRAKIVEKLSAFSRASPNATISFGISTEIHY